MPRIITPASQETLEIRYLVGERVNDKSVADRITDVLTDIATVNTGVTGIQSDLDDSIIGLAALKTLLDSVQSSVSAIQNNTRLTTSISQEVDRPDTGSVYLKFFVNLYNSVGNKEDPDSNEIVVVLTTSNGTDITTSRIFKDGSGTALDDSTLFSGYKKIVRDSLGRYYFFYKSSASDAIDTLNVHLRYKENGVDNNADRSIRVVEELGANAATLANQTTIINNQSTAQTAIDAIKAKTDNLPSDTAAEFTAIKGSGFNTGTHSLKAIRDAIGSSSIAVFSASKTSSAVSQGNSASLALSTEEGFLYAKCLIKKLRVAVSGATTNFKVEVFEKSGEQNKLIEVQMGDSSGIDLAFDEVFINSDTTPTNMIYVKITNIADTGSSTFTVTIRGESRL